MTYIEAYREGIRLLKKNNIPDYNFDNRLIFENIFGLNRVQLLMNENVQASEDKLKKYFKDIKLRSKNLPLQYILGSWDFMGHTFKVGKGVLIPREETEIVVNEVVKLFKQLNIENPVVFDLCSGSGCIGISIARLAPNATVYLLEKSNSALKYLKQNVEECSLNNIIIKKCDITNIEDLKDFPNCDLLVSNPPYIKSDEIDSLQLEVQNEPSIALDGGNDGLFFYRCIYNNWTDKLLDKGYMILEIGENQEQEIEKIYKSKFNLISKIKDINNIYRTLVFKKH